MNGPESVATYTSQVHFLSMDPVAPNPPPAHLVKLMYGSQSEDAWPACVFWKRWEDEVVRPGIQAATDADVEEFQMSVVTGKVIVLAQADSLDEVVDKIIELCEYYIHNVKDSFASGV